MARRETENNAYAKFWGDKQKTLWYVMVFSGVVNCGMSHVIFRAHGMTQSLQQGGIASCNASIHLL